MSRIGKKPITIPSGVEVTINGGSVTVKGAKGTLAREIDTDFYSCYRGWCTDRTETNRTEKT